MFEFVCVMFFTHQLDEHLYIGHFKSCDAAYVYIEQHYEPQEYTWIKCLHQDYINLPKNLIKKEMDNEQ